MLLTVEKITYCNIKNNTKNMRSIRCLPIDSVSFYYGGGPPHGPKQYIYISYTKFEDNR
jgi:hypothetical protein